MAEMPHWFMQLEDSFLPPETLHAASRQKEKD
jgi:hypothetical protein